MRFYTQQHAFYCGVDLHAKTMHVCVVDQSGETLVHRYLPSRPDYFLNAIGLYRKELVVGGELLVAIHVQGEVAIDEHVEVGIADLTARYAQSDPRNPLLPNFLQRDLTILVGIELFDERRRPVKLATIERAVAVGVQRREQRVRRKRQGPTQRDAIRNFVTLQPSEVGIG